MLEDDQRGSNQQDEIHLFTAWHPWESYFRQRPSIFRTGVCAVHQGVGFQSSQKQSSYPQSNGLAKKAVHTVEQLLKKVKLEQRVPYLSLLEYRNISVDWLATPAQLLMSKQLRSILPTTNNHLWPRVVHPDQARERMEKKTGHSTTLL